MELKDIVIYLSVALLFFTLGSIAYTDITNNTNIDLGSSSLDNSSKYEEKLDNVKEDARGNYQNTSSVGATEDSAFDKLGALVESGFDSANKGLDSVEDTAGIINDVQNDTSGVIPTVVFSFIIGVLFILLSFGLIRLLTGR